MSRLKRTTSKVVLLAATRAAGLESIDPTPEFGPDATFTGYKAAIASAQTKQAAYNTLLAESDEAQNAFEAAEIKLRDYTERMLAGIAAHYGKNSSEYEMAGGRRKIDRRRRPASAASSPSTKPA